MAIYNGNPTYKRNKARNFTEEHAQKRLEQTVASANQQYINSLFVNAVEIDLYQTAVSERPCTCEKAEVLPELARNSHLPSQKDGASIDYEFQENIFGEPAEQLYNDEILDLIDTAADIEKTGMSSVEYKDQALAGANIKCGICYRTGYQPGYVAYHKQRNVFTTLDLVNLDGYLIDRSRMPHRFERQHDNAYTRFKIRVPKYFKDCGASIRDNCQELADVLYHNGQPVTKTLLNQYKGQELVFDVLASAFTHCVIEFDLGLAKPRADLSAEILALDYRRQIALGSFSIVLSPNIQKVQDQDIIVIQKRGIALKLNEVRPRQTSDRQIMGWDCQARVLQPNEEQSRIHVLTKIR
jgi:hypothetical protein